MNINDLMRRLECGPIDCCTAQAAAKALVDIGAERDCHARHSDEYFQKLNGWMQGERERRARAETAERKLVEAEAYLKTAESAIIESDGLLLRLASAERERDEARAKLAELNELHAGALLTIGKLESNTKTEEGK